MRHVTFLETSSDGKQSALFVVSEQGGRLVFLSGDKSAAIASGVLDSGLPLDGLQNAYSGSRFRATAPSNNLAERFSSAYCSAVERYRKIKAAPGQKSLFGDDDEGPATTTTKGDGDGRWVTLQGHIHVFIDHGTITKGPSHLVGKSPDQIDNDPPKSKTESEAPREREREPVDNGGGVRSGDEPAGREPGNDRSGGNFGSRVPEGKDRIVTVRAEHTPKPDLSLVPKNLQQHLSEHQREGTAAAIGAMDRHGGFVLADGTGVGKTRQALAVAENYAQQGKKVLIVTKSEVLGKPKPKDWKSGTFAGSFWNDAKTMGIDAKLNNGETPLQAGQVHITTYDRLAKIADEVDDNTVVVWDEAQAVKNWDSARSKQAYGMNRLADKVLYTTATTIDKPQQLAYLFRAKVFGDRKWDDTKRELGMRLQTINVGGGRTVQEWVIDPHVGKPECCRRLAGLFDRMTSDGLMLKREISMEGVDVGFQQVELPTKTHEVMDAIARDAYTSAPKGLRKALVLMAQRRQQEPDKVPHAVAAALEDIKAGRQVVIYCSRINESSVTKRQYVPGGDVTEKVIASSEGTAKLLREALEAAGVKDIVELHGNSETSASEAMERFQSGKAKVVIATLESGGTGINLDDTVGDKPRSMIIMTPPLSGMDNVQAIGRVWRLNTKSYPKIRYLFGNTDVDRWNSHLLSGKMRTLKASVSGAVEKMDVTPDDDDDEQEVLDQLAADAIARKGSYEWHPLVSGGKAKIQKTPVATEEKPSESAIQAMPEPSETRPSESHVPTVQTRQVQTRNGAKHVHSFAPNSEFWTAWRKWKDRGNKPPYVSVGKNPKNGDWEVAVWGDTPDQVSRNMADLKQRYSRYLSAGSLVERFARIYAFHVCYHRRRPLERFSSSRSRSPIVVDLVSRFSAAVASACSSPPVERFGHGSLFNKGQDLYEQTFADYKPPAGSTAPKAPKSITGQQSLFGEGGPGAKPAKHRDPAHQATLFSASAVNPLVGKMVVALGSVL